MADHRIQAQQQQQQQQQQKQQQQQYETRAALDEFVAKASPSSYLSSEGGSSSSKGVGWLGWFRGFFLPEAFDSLPLPILALVWHGVVVMSMMLLRPGGAAGASLRAAPTVTEQEGGSSSSSSGGLLGGVGNKSMIETVAISMGLGWVLEGWKVAQTAWQDVLIFSFFFLLTVAACA